MSVTPVAIQGVRGGPDAATLRRDRWWLAPVLTVAALVAFVGYSTWAAFTNADYYAGPELGRNLLSPFYSPCITNQCLAHPGSHPGLVFHWWNISPAILILIFPTGFRLTCYYYRRAYYRSFWLSPPACAVADAHPRYTGETRFPLVLQNAHRYFLYFALVLNVILSVDAVEAYRFPGSGVGVSLGSLVLTANAVLLWLYTLSCHSCRHLCGGQVDRFSEHPLRYRLWRALTPLNARHMNFAWVSLAVVALADLYVRLVASGTIHDPRII
ncbi:MAG TPA: hypothetical protein VKY15_00835 [Acidimicrobiales bacterium]|nr:hypothetical protein [Acidimicrobiales bacterium]